MCACQLSSVFRRASARAGVFLFVFAVLPALRAHDPGLSTAEAQITRDTITLTTAFAPADVAALLPLTARGGAKWTPADFVAAEPLLAALAPQLWELRVGGAPVMPREARAELAPGDSLIFHLTYPRPTAEKISFRALKLGVLPPGHREYFSAADAAGAVLIERLLSAKSDSVELSLTAGAAAAEEGPVTFWGFLKLGVEHIWTGYDHLLFLFALLVVCRSFKSIVAIISCFTLAHSLTLALATLNVFNLPSRFVEPAIAASIIFVGVENLVRRGEEPRGRWALTFCFGLIHGFGFASVLRELGVGSGGQGLAMPLFTFNLGVEIGQVAVAAVVLPIVWQLRKNEKFIARGVPALSAVVVAAGLYWFLERTVFV